MVRAATHAAWTNAVFSQGAPGRVRVDRHFAALSSRRGQNPAQDYEVAGRGEPAHVESNFRNDDPGNSVTDRGDCHESVDGGLKGHEGLAQARLHFAHGSLKGVDVRQVQAQKEPVMGRHPPMQGRDDCRAGGLEATLTQVSETLRVLLAPNDAVQYGAATQRLGLFSELGVSLKTTNILESIHARVEDRTARVDHWRNSEQKQRWLATALLDLEPRLRRIKSFRALPLLREALKRHVQTGKKSAA